MPRKITPFLWFNDNAEEAMRFYMSVFPDSEILSVNRLPGDGSGAEGRVLTASFRLLGQELMVLNGGPHYTLNEAFSLFVTCESQEEVDTLWAKLTEGGEESQCGWLKDRFGLSWQIIPSVLGDLLGDPDAARAGRVMQAMLQMRKIDIAKLREAHEAA